MNTRVNDTITYELTRRFLNNVTRKFVGDAEIKTKSEATDIRYKIARFVVVNILRIKAFDTYAQGIGKTIYVPDDFYVKENPLDALRLIAHESIHLYDRQRLGMKFSLGYIFPQVLSPLFFLLALVLWNAWFLIPALLLLAPLPAYWRAKLELRAYVTDIIWSQYVWELRLMEENEKWAKEKFQKHMSSETYYFCFPFKKLTRKWFEQKLLRHKWKQISPYKEIISFLQEELET